MMDEHTSDAQLTDAVATAKAIWQGAVRAEPVDVRVHARTRSIARNKSVLHEKIYVARRRHKSPPIQVLQSLHRQAGESQGGKSEGQDKISESRVATED